MSSFDVEEIRRELEFAQMEVQAAKEREQAALQREQAAQERARAAEAEAGVLRAAAAGGSGGGGAAAAAPVADSISAALVFPRRPIKSPTGEHVPCFLEDPFVALVHEPVTLPVDASLSSAFAGLLAAAGSARRMGQERTFYPLATAHLPDFAQAVGKPLGDMTAEALFSPSALATPVWSFPPGCKPELHARAAAGGVGGGGGGGGGSLQSALCPAFNGELKSAGDGRALERAALYTVLDLVRVFFPAEPAPNPVAASAAAAACAANRRRLFYSTPPLGYALVAYPYMAQVFAVECLGKMLVSPFSQPFLLGSQQHVSAMAALPQPRFEAPLVLDLSVVKPWRTAPGAREELTSWCTEGGVFRKLVRGDARTGAGFAAMHAAYARLSAVLPHAPTRLRLPSSLRLRYGLHCVLVELEPVVVGRAALEEAELRLAGSPLLLSVARAIAWLAAQRVIYTDLRAPHVVVDGKGGAWLMDYDDCIVVKEAVRSVEAFKAAVSACPGAGEPGTFAAYLCAGTEVAFEAALGQAFCEAAAAGWDPSAAV